MNNNAFEQFDRAMRGIYEAALQLDSPYRATYLLRSVNELGGKAAADRLLAAPRPSEGFTQLFLKGGLDGLRLSVEYLVLQKPWRDLFTAEQLAIARKRLVEVDCPLPQND